MTDNQFNFLNMVGADIAVLSEAQYAAILTGSTKLAAELAAVKNTHVTILSVAGLQSQINKGPTITKETLLQAAASKADHICSAVRAYADDINDANLLASMHYTYKGLLYVSTNQAIIDMRLIHDAAAAITIADLLPFNVVATDITDLKTAIDSFEAAAPGKRAMVVDTSVATAQLPPLFTTQRKQLKKLDNLVSTFRLVNPSFVEAHFKARKIINLGKTMQAEELHLMPQSFESIFGMKFSEGDTFILRNHSGYEIQAALTDTPAVLPTAGIIKISANTEIKVAIPKDFGGVFGHWLVIMNTNPLDDIHATVILASHKPSGSGLDLAGKIK
jgi:hypothetical protein